MSLIDSKRRMNWSGTSFATHPIDGVKRVSIDRGITDLQEGADMDLGPTIAIVTQRNPSFTVNTISATITIPFEDAVGVFTTTLNDARNQAAVGGGGVVFTTNALSYIGADGIEGEFMNLATDTVTFKTCWTDGVTNPISVTAR
jgi:hypothetical protein